MPRLSFFKLALRGLVFYRRTNLSVAAGAAVASAVLVGAMLVGDSVDFSLRRLALLRLGGARYAMNTYNRFFDTDLRDRLARKVQVPVSAVMSLNGIAIHRDWESGDSSQVNNITVLGVADSFWALSKGEPVNLGRDEIAVSRKLAVALGVKAGDDLSLRIAKPSLMPRDAPLASRKEGLSARTALRIKTIVPDSQLGRFSLRANQIAPYNAFVSIETLQELSGLKERANILLVGGGANTAPGPEELDAALRDAWRLSHAGIRLRRDEQHGVIQLESDRVFLDPSIAKSALAARLSPESSGPVGTLAYLVNSIETSDGKHSVPYSFVVAAGSSGNSSLSAVPSEMQNDEIVINDWLAGKLNAGKGETIKIRYYQVTSSGDFVERERAFRVHSVVKTRALSAERDLMPEFPGLTDVNQCADWDIGMPMEEDLLRDEANQDYWEKHRTTPKAFFTLRAGQDMWANRFGDLSAVRYPSETGIEELSDRLRRDISPESIGFFFMPVREQALKAVNQAMNFGELFLGMSFFLIAAALLLTGLLFVFGIEHRAPEMGTLLAVGFRRKRLRYMFLAEGLLIALIASIAGSLLGSIYTRGLIWGLGTYWQGAIAGAAIRYHAEPGTMAIGMVSSVIAALAAIAMAMRRQTRKTARELLYEDQTQSPVVYRRKRGALCFAVSIGLTIVAVCVIAFTVVTDSRQVVPAFFGAGALLLAASLGFSRAVLSRLEPETAQRLTVKAMGMRNAARRPGRSLAVTGLLASGFFIIATVSSMKSDIKANANERWSGTGGFELFARSTIPAPDRLDRKGALQRFGLQDRPELEGVEFVSIRVHEGDDASCFNLNRAQAPRLLGVDVDEFIQRSAFMPSLGENEIWHRLKADLPDGVIPGLVGDSDTADWGLQKKTGPKDGDLLAYTDERGNTFKVKLMGKLPMRLSVFQGTILIPGDAFAERFPSKGGFSMFLADVPSDAVNDVRRVLTEGMDEVGLSVQPAADRVLEFYTVESSYLGMFLVLGGLGLLLGTFGMGIVALRNIFERRSELAILRCVGYSRSETVRVVTAEHWILLVMGLAGGGISAFAAVWPNISSPGAGAPYFAVMGLLAAAFFAGRLWITIASRLALRRPLIPALRNE